MEAIVDRHPIERLIETADTAINQEDFDTLIGCYTDDAVLVIQTGRNAIGKAQLRQAFEAIAAHFEHTLRVKQVGMEILETGDTALMLAKTLISAAGHPTIEREAIYVFRKTSDSDWLCAIDNSYGHELLKEI